MWHKRNRRRGTISKSSSTQSSAKKVLLTPAGLLLPTRQAGRVSVVISSKPSSDQAQQLPAHLVLSLSSETSSQDTTASSAAAGLALAQQLAGMKGEMLHGVNLAVSTAVPGSELAANSLQPMPSSALAADTAGAVVGILRTAATENANGAYGIVDRDPLTGWEASKPASVAVAKGGAGWLSHVGEKQQVEWVPRLVPADLEQQLEWASITPEPRSSLNNLVVKSVDLAKVRHACSLTQGNWYEVVAKDGQQVSTDKQHIL